MNYSTINDSSKGGKNTVSLYSKSFLTPWKAPARTPRGVKQKNPTPFNS